MVFGKEVKVGVYLLFSLLVVISLCQFVFSRELVSETSFNVFIEGGKVCSNGQSQWTDGSINPPTITPTIGPLAGNCFDPSGISTTGESMVNCCPAGYKCVADTPPTQYHCKLDEKYYCHQLNANKNECEDNSFAEANKSVVDLLGGQCGYISGSEYPVEWDVNNNPTQYCWNITDCSCKWYPMTGTNKCNITRTNSVKCTPEVTTPPLPIPGDCMTDIGAYEDLCLTEGFIHIEWTSIGTGEFLDDPTCQSGSRDVPCEGIVKMDFFNEYNFVITIISFIFIYSFFILVKRRKIIKSE